VKILYFNILFNCLIISSVVAFVFSTVGILVERVSGSLNVCLIFLIPIIIKEYAYNKKIKILYYIVALVYCFLILRANYNKVNRDGIYQFLPYKTVFYK
jgi:Na+/H+ antiporter NhaA